MTVSRRQFLERLAQGAALAPMAACSTGPGADARASDGGELDAGAGLGPDCSADSATLDTQPAFSFEHGVASGDPSHEGVRLWTRLTPATALAADAVLTVEVVIARDADFTDVVATARACTDAGVDFTLRFDAEGLTAGTSYFYRFADPTRPEVASDLGRTRTLPAGKVEALRIAVVCCSCYSEGFFNAYQDIAARDDLDLVLHLGDYIYEYGTELYYDGALDRAPLPAHEIVSLSDYRTRHAQYRRDPDLRALHARHPVISIWDDHEITNNASRTGAANHSPESEGDYQLRRAVALRAYLEWLPARAPDPNERSRLYRTAAAGDLCDLVVLDTRSLRDVQDLGRADDPDRSLLGEAQAAWLENELMASVERGTAWRVIVQQVLMLELKKLTDRNADTWDGYRASRNRLLSFLRDERVPDVVVLSGDWHSSWAGELAPDPFATDPTQSTPVAVELHCPSVTSPLPRGLAQLWADTQKLAPHAHVRWVELARHGYLTLDITHEKVQSEWCFTQTVKAPDGTHELGKTFSVTRGSARLTEAKS